MSPCLSLLTQCDRCLIVSASFAGGRCPNCGFNPPLKDKAFRRRRPYPDDERFHQSKPK